VVGIEVHGRMYPFFCTRFLLSFFFPLVYMCVRFAGLNSEENKGTQKKTLHNKKKENQPTNHHIKGTDHNPFYFFPHRTLY